MAGVEGLENTTKKDQCLIWRGNLFREYTGALLDSNGMILYDTELGAT